MSANLFSAGAILVMFILFTYMFLGSLFEKYKPPIGHEASIVILVGMIISYSLMMSGHNDLTKALTFDENFFFYFCLPPIVFASGYNMKRKKFFANIKNILIFGLVGTIVQFTYFSVFTYLVVEADVLVKYVSETG
jgi:NhaP-type Na+/H+ or K+/H+ antiporter